MLSRDSRIVYEEDTGKWRVLWQGQFIKQVFKTAKDATEHLLSLREHRVKPEWSK